MKLKLYRVSTRTVNAYYDRLYIYCIGTDIETVAKRIGVPPHDVQELDNEVTVHLTISDVNVTRGRFNNG